RFEHIDPELPVIFDLERCPGEIMSYRGYYRFPAVEPTDDGCTAGEFLSRVRDAIGRTVEGYKGGDFTMTRHSPLWVSDYGTASGRGVVGVKIEDDQVVLETAIIADGW